MKRHTKGAIAAQARQIVAGLLCLALLAGVFPWLAVAQAVSPWVNTAEDYLRQMVDWKIMRGDLEGNLNPENDITRAEFVAMVNRAYGYKHIAGATTPFVDVPTNVPEKDIPWYADDVATAYRMGYIKGTSESEFSPEDKLTREQAVVIIGRNMMLTPALGEVLAFNDGRDFSDWSRGWIQTCAEVGVAIGYEDGSFRPQQNITRGEVAAMLVRALGNLINGQSETTLGHVPGNVTINTSNTTLKDTVVAGDLYLTGGIELGDVLLDNVTVLGRIVAIGAGEGNDAQSSIVLRNCRAAELVVDSIAKQFASIRTEGNSVVVDKTSVRTEAYLEDRTGAGLGMKLINIDSDTGIGVQLAGNIKDVFNYTPNSVVTVARGVADKVSVDEKATNSKVEVLNGARVKDMNLDVGTTVTGNSMGTGDIDRLHVYSDGSVVEQLPNTIDVRPGVTTTVNGKVMDTGIAAESSEDPRLLAGYPEARNVAPTTAEAVFSANKAGTVYWAVTAVADGSVSKADLLKPPAYSSRIIASGTTRLDASGKESIVKLSKLTMDGSYYISAILVDDRKQESPIKVTAFTTPDNSAPAFAKGYPAMGEITNSSGQVKIMATKTCQLYYAILPKGSTAPTLNDFRTGAISGSLGHGTRPAIKNAIDLFNVNSRSLQEQTEYDVYLCLYDADGGKSSNVAKLTFKTADGTPPVLTGPLDKPQATSVQLSASMNEAGILYWVVVEEGQEFPAPLPGQSGTPALDSETAKNAVMMGIGGLKSGSVKATAGRTFTFTPSGLERHTSYDLYYLAVDSAGNSREVMKMRINTIDNEPPTVRLEFTSTSDEEGLKPRADTGLRVIFNESIQTVEENQIFLETYNAMINETDRNKQARLKEAWGTLVHSHITLMSGESNHNNVTNVSLDKTKSEWVDYSEVTLKTDGKELVFTFPNRRAVQLISGSKYYFRLSNIQDLASNKMNKGQDYLMPTFQINIAEVILTKEDPNNLPVASGGSTEYVRADMWFQVKPDTSATVSEDAFFDVLLWSESNFSFILYGRVLKDNNPLPSTSTVQFPLLGNKSASDASYSNGWIRLSDETNPPSIRPGSNTKAGLSITNIANGQNTSTITFSKLREFFENGYTYEFAIQRVGTENEYKRWGDQVKLDVQVVAGAQSDVRGLANSVSQTSPYLSRLDSIGTQGFYVDHQFQNLTAPDFTSGYPSFTGGINGDREVTIDVNLNDSGEVYYVLAKVDATSGKQDVETKDAVGYVWPTTVTTGTGDDAVTKNIPPKSGEDWNNCPTLTAPKIDKITGDQVGGKRVWDFNNDDVKTGVFSVSGNRTSVTVKDLQPETTYYAYFVIQSKTDSNITSRVFCYQFTTDPDRKPIITMTYSPAATGNSQTVGIRTVKDATLNWVVMNPNDVAVPEFLTKEFKSGTGEYAINEFTEAMAKAYDKSADGDDRSFSVLDALMADVGNGEGSVFDKYARPETGEGSIRAMVEAYIAATTGVGSDGKITNGQMTFTARNDVINSQNANIPNELLPSAGGKCICLAVSRTSTGVLAFKGIGNISQPNRVKPDIISVSNVWISAKKTTSADSKEIVTYSGHITLNFTETIYFTSEGSSKRTLPVYFTAPTGVGEDRYKLLKDIVTSYVRNSGETAGTVAPIYDASGYTGQVTKRIEIDFKNVESGSSITLFNSGTITSQGGDGFGSPLMIELSSVISKEDSLLGTDFNTDPFLKITWRGSTFDGKMFDANGQEMKQE